MTACPNCGVEGHHDLGQAGFDEYRCGNDNCRVEVYRVGRSGTDTDRSGEGSDR